METFLNNCIPFEITILVISSARIWLNMLIAWILTFSVLHRMVWAAEERFDASVEIDQYSEYFYKILRYEACEIPNQQWS